jgi:hemerythrin-like domain-containing protein
MRIAKTFRKDQETILRFLDVFGGGSAALGTSNKHAQAGFFVVAGTFIQEYIEDTFFKKVELLLKALEESGFPAEEGPIAAMRDEQKKSRESAEQLHKAAKAWQSGDEEGRVVVSWESSQYSSTVRHHLDRLKNLIFPLLEQNVTPEEEHKIAEGMNHIAFENSMKGDESKYIKLIETLEEELSDWK